VLAVVVKYSGKVWAWPAGAKNAEVSPKTTIDVKNGRDLLAFMTLIPKGRS
jgi:hypothetical protein